MPNKSFSSLAPSYACICKKYLLSNTAKQSVEVPAEGIKSFELQATKILYFRKKQGRRGLSYEEASIQKVSTVLKNASKQIRRTPTSNAKRQHRRIETNIPRKGIARPQSQFPHSCVCERLIYFHHRSAYSAAGKYVERDPGNI